MLTFPFYLTNCNFVQNKHFWRIELVLSKQTSLYIFELFRIWLSFRIDVRCSSSDTWPVCTMTPQNVLFANTLPDWLSNFDCCPRSVTGFEVKSSGTKVKRIFLYTQNSAKPTFFTSPIINGVTDVISLNKIPIKIVQLIA